MHTKSIFDLQKYVTGKCLNKMCILHKCTGFGEKTKVDLTFLESRNTSLSSEARIVEQESLEFDCHLVLFIVFLIFSQLENDLVF